MSSRTYERWAIVRKPFVVFPLYWSDAFDFPIETFRTRNQARESLKISRISKAQIIKVLISIESLE